MYPYDSEMIRQTQAYRQALRVQLRKFATTAWLPGAASRWTPPQYVQIQSIIQAKAAGDHRSTLDLISQAIEHGMFSKPGVASSVGLPSVGTKYSIQDVASFQLALMQTLCPPPRGQHPLATAMPEAQQLVGSTPWVAPAVQLLLCWVVGKHNAMQGPAGSELRQVMRGMGKAACMQGDLVSLQALASLFTHLGSRGWRDVSVLVPHATSAAMLAAWLLQPSMAVPGLALTTTLSPQAQAAGVLSALTDTPSTVQLVQACAHVLSKATELRDSAVLPASLKVAKAARGSGGVHATWSWATQAPSSAAAARHVLSAAPGLQSAHEQAWQTAHAAYVTALGAMLRDLVFNVAHSPSVQSGHVYDQARHAGSGAQLSSFAVSSLCSTLTSAARDAHELALPDLCNGLLQDACKLTAAYTSTAQSDSSQRSALPDEPLNQQQKSSALQDKPLLEPIATALAACATVLRVDVGLALLSELQTMSAHDSSYAASLRRGVLGLSAGWVQLVTWQLLGAAPSLRVGMELSVRSATEVCGLYAAGRSIWQADTVLATRSFTSVVQAAMQRSVRPGPALLRALTPLTPPVVSERALNAAAGPGAASIPWPRQRQVAMRPYAMHAAAGIWAAWASSARAEVRQAMVAWAACVTAAACAGQWQALPGSFVLQATSAKPAVMPPSEPSPVAPAWAAYAVGLDVWQWASASAAAAGGEPSGQPGPDGPSLVVEVEASMPVQRLLGTVHNAVMQAEHGRGTTLQADACPPLASIHVRPSERHQQAATVRISAPDPVLQAVATALRSS